MSFQYFLKLYYIIYADTQSYHKYLKTTQVTSHKYLIHISLIKSFVMLLNTNYLHISYIQLQHTSHLRILGILHRKLILGRKSHIENLMYVLYTNIVLHIIHVVQFFTYVLTPIIKYLIVDMH